MNNLYKILGVKQDSSSEEIKKAYFTMAKKHHPDASNRSELDKFHEVAKAYKTLSDIEERRIYNLSLGKDKIGNIVVENPPPHPTIYKQESGKTDESRLKERYHFQRSIFWKAVFRVIGFSLLSMGVAYVLTFVLNGIWYAGILAGFCIGFPLSLKQNFDLKSFIKSGRRRLTARIFGWVLFILGVGYFLFLIFIFSSML